MLVGGVVANGGGAEIPAPESWPIPEPGGRAAMFTAFGSVFTLRSGRLKFCGEIDVFCKFRIAGKLLLENPEGPEENPPGPPLMGEEA